MNTLNRFITLIVLISFASGCAFIAVNKYEEHYGSAKVVDRQVASLQSGQVDYWTEVKPILEQRCVACHACYDAQCQLKLTSIEGIERGAFKERIYNTSRILPADPTRLYEDAKSTQEWRDKGFHSVLNEYTQTPEVNLQASLLHRFLQLKQQHPLPQEKLLPKEFTLDINRAEQCTTAADFDEFAKKKPLWGMPYGLPQISEQEFRTLSAWLEQGATYTPRTPLAKKFVAQIQQWETFLNGDSLKAQLVSRYIYEHLYLAHLYFSEISESNFFRVVRSKTPPGQPLERIATRRPYDDPGVERVYYRIVPELEAIVAKTHKPYKLNSERKKLWNKLFFVIDYDVTEKVSYEPDMAGNPFVSFEQLPMKSRYKFLLFEAQFTIMNFVKGTVCRGQVAVNVIHDRFWVFFVDPDLPIADKIEDIVIVSQKDLELPSVKEDIYMPLSSWANYAAKERRLRKRRDKFLSENFNGQFSVKLDNLWDGDGHNQNAALTVMRHFDYASVEKGLLGNEPKTAWVIGYPLLERIHYLLVAGYDVYGNLGHQLLSRLHMDFLRMDGESAFLMMLPPESRDKVRNHWHRDAPKEANVFLTNPVFEENAVIDIPYQTQDHKAELMSLLKAYLQPVLPLRHEIDYADNPRLVSALERLKHFAGTPALLLPETSILRFHTQGKEDNYVTLVKDVAHKNMSSIFGEKKRIVPEETAVTVLKGIYGSYTKAIFSIEMSQADAFVDQVLRLKTAGDYERLVDGFGIRRTNPNFWQESDRMNLAAKKQNPVEYGIFDLNRYENR